MNKVLLIFIFLLGFLPSFAQASLEIILLDEKEQPVPDQLVLVSNVSIGFMEQAISDKQGLVQLTGLSTSGMYKVELADNLFYQASPATRVVLISSRTTTVVLRLLDKTLSLDEISVVANQYLTINTVDAEVASELTDKEMEALPVEGRDITRVLYRLPNVSLATGFFPEAPTVSINGANSLYTSYQIDGMDNNENFLGGQRFAMPLGFAKNVTALTNNFSAEHGLSANGIINVTSRSGTNEISREIFYVTRPGPALDGTPDFAQRDLSGNPVKNGFQRHQAGFSQGGAIRKDKAFYFVNFEHTTDLKENALTADVLGVNETIKGTNNFTYFSGRLDQQWNNRWHSSLRWNAGIVNIERQGGGLEGGLIFPSAGNRQDRNAFNLALKNTRRGDNLVYESNFQYGSFRWNYANPENPQSPNVTIETPDGQVAAILGHPGYVFDEKEQNVQVQQKLTYYRRRHTLKGGLQYKYADFSLFGGGNPNGSYVVRLSDTQLSELRSLRRGAALLPQDLPADVQVLFYGIELRPSAFQKDQQIFSIYIEDQWALHPRWNLNMGLRYDYDNLSRGGGSKGDFNNLAPRLGLNYQLDANTTLRAGYGVYYDKILYAVYSDALQFNSTSPDYKKQLQHLIDQGLLPQSADIDALTNEGNLVGTLPSVAYLSGPSSDALNYQRSDVFQNELRILNPSGYQNPYSHQWMIGLQKKISEKSLVYIDLMHNRSHNLFRLRNINAPAPYPLDPENIVVRSQIQADASRPVPIYADSEGYYALAGGEKLRGAARNVMVTETAGESKYYALNVSWQKDRGEDSYAWRLIYTLSSLENNTEDINFRAMDSNNFDAEWGPSINDRRHLINGLLYWYPTKKLRLNLATLIQSGQPVNRIPDARLYGTADLNGDGRSFGDAYVGNSDRQPGESRNSDRLPWAVTIDWSLYWTLSAGSSGSVELGAQVFNVLDAENWSGYANHATLSNQIQPGTAASGLFIRRNAAPPRQFQFSLRYLFN